jgi:hypothetical protein
MPSGIIIKSASHEVSDEVRDANVKAVVEGAGYEVPEPEPPAEPARADFKTDEEFEAAHVEWQDKEEEKAAKAEEEPAAPRKSRKTRAIERATADLRRENEELKKKLEAKGEGTAPKQDDAPKEKQRPRRAEFEQGEDGQQKYEDALLSWGAEKAITDKALKDAEAANKARFEENIRSYAAQVEEAKDKYDDWDEVVNQEIFIGKGAQLAILELPENAAEVIYYLGRHPAYATKLGEMSEHSAIMEVGRLSQKLLTGAPATGEANGEDKQKTKPKVPAPVRTVNTGGPSGSPTFAEIAAKPNYPGKARDLRRASAAGE